MQRGRIWGSTHWINVLQNANQGDYTSHLKTIIVLEWTVSVIALKRLSAPWTIWTEKIYILLETVSHFYKLLKSDQSFSCEFFRTTSSSASPRFQKSILTITKDIYRYQKTFCSGSYRLPIQCYYVFKFLACFSRMGWWIYLPIIHTPYFYCQSKSIRC